MLAAIFLMQPMGQLCAFAVGWFTLLSMNEYRLSYYASAAQNGIDQNTKVIVGGLWRWITRIGALLAFIALIFRLTITDPGRCTLDVVNDPDRAVRETEQHYRKALGADIEMENQDANGEAAQGQVNADGETLPASFSRADIYDFFIYQGNWRYLAGMSACWFLLDLSFFKLRVNSHHTLSKVWAETRISTSNLPNWNPDPTHPERNIYDVLANNAYQPVVTVSVGSLFKSIIAIATIDRITRKKILAWPFLLLAAFLLITSGLFLQFHGTRHRIVIIIFYALVGPILTWASRTHVREPLD